MSNYQSSPSVDRHSAAPPRERAGAFNILLVEDHADTAAAISLLLKRRGHAVQVAHTVAAAIQSAEVARVDLLVCDLNLPDGNGRDLLVRLRERHNVRGICLSGQGQDEDIQQSKTAGFSVHLAKPVDIQKLESLIQQIG